MRLRVVAIAFASTLLPAVAFSPDAPTLGPRGAEAAVSVLMSLDELVAASTYAVVATAHERRSVWEEVGGSRRIVTYTRLAVERSVLGSAGSELWVRTLGGVVGKIGQTVSGEAQIAPGSRSLLFLANVEGILVVTGLAQGHFRVVAEDGGPPRLRPSPEAGVLLPRRGPAISAREVLVGATLDDAVKAIERARRAQDARK